MHKSYRMLRLLLLYARYTANSHANFERRTNGIAIEILLEFTQFSPFGCGNLNVCLTTLSGYVSLSGRWNAI